MPQKEIDIVINDRDIEQSEKKLRSMDRMLQQTQRRAAVLGRTRMTPVISLDDRFSTKARFITRRMTLLDRMSANPIVRLIDNASARISRIRDSLVQLTRTPWRVTISGLNGDVATCTSFADLLGDESFYTEVGKKAGETYFEAFLAVLDPQRITDKLGQGTMGNSGKRGTSDQENMDSKGSDKSKGWLGGVLDFGKEIGIALLVDMFSKKIGNKMTGIGDFLSKESTSGKVKDGLKSSSKASTEASKVASKIPSRLETYGRRGKFFSKALPFLGKLLGGAGMILTMYDTQKYLDSSGISDLTREAPKIMWEQLSTPRTEINGKPVKDMGFFESLSELGKENYNALTNKEAWENIGDAWKSMGALFTGKNINEEFLRRVTEREQKAQGGPIQQATPNDFSTNPNYILDPIERIKQNHEIFKSFNPMERTNQIINGTKSTNLDSSVQFPTNQSRVPGITSNDNKLKVDNSVNVSVAPGAINLTIQKDEINYDEIAQKVGGMIASQVRFAMMNMS